MSDQTIPPKNPTPNEVALWEAKGWSFTRTADASWWLKGNTVEIEGEARFPRLFRGQG